MLDGIHKDGFYKENTETDEIEKLKSELRDIKKIIVQIKENHALKNQLSSNLCSEKKNNLWEQMDSALKDIMDIFDISSEDLNET